ncbi:hypothetical protein ACERIM_04920 [Natrinema sp. H-ect1]|uniref:DUF7096 domain-containing protein n=1 Tax=Natrinema sp. H-ect1 TaxID=3242700 RepID=UPI00359CD0D1
MNRAIPSLLAVLLVLSLLAIPAMATPTTGANDATETLHQESLLRSNSMVPQTVNNTTNRLSLDETSRSEYADYGSDLGAALASADDEIRVDHAQYTTVDQGFDDATAAERRELLQNGYERLVAQSKALEERERRAVRAHASNELSSAQLLQVLLRNHREAAVLSEAFAELNERSEQVQDFSLSVSDERDKLEMHRTKIRSQLDSAYRYGDSVNGNVILIETSQNGFVLSLLGDSYVREAVRFDNRNASQSTQFEDILDAYDHARGLYPWAYETVQSPSFNEYTTVKLYKINNNHDQGDLEAYLDGGTGDIYREVQILDRTSLPNKNNTTAVKNGLKLSIMETKANGPATVVVNDSETGDPVSATITIDGFAVGTTDDDGGLWYVPPGDEYELRAETADGASASVILSSS